MTDKKKVNNFDVLDLMCEREMNIYAFPLGTNMKRANTGKDNYGEMVIAVANDVILSMAMGKKLTGVLLIYDAPQFDAIKKELEQEETE